ncbi:MBL fold metallo-hydrolase [Microtetraspora sp. NBRC 13810]|uniref:N-acyl homoserine lactonase family protein n=1 Tax=Microtetraspora sp. NBRC 13810 TaxID=3030990 RepID=UPI0024A4C018|nr:N-acyl homoserine lactonase family protein [Microtetraspora sp. NBRC 13810]GLW06662.1 MBL fold metallo-hydrolase [Microtetraspora sp. NBRC 13810]
MTGGPAGYEVYAVRYGTRRTSTGEVYLNHDVYGVPDEPVGMDYYLWVARDDRRTVVIDTGFGGSGGARRGRTALGDPVALLADLGVRAAAVPQVVVTHAHYDHIGNLARFPAAEVIVSRREFDFWTGPYARRAQFAWAAEPAEIAHLAAVRGQGRATLFDGPHDVAPGIEVLPVGGHTPGQAVVLVAARGGGQVVLASDAAHYYEELELDRPFAFTADLEAAYRAFDLLKEITAGPGRVLVPGHDPEVMRRFPGAPGPAVRLDCMTIV